MKRLLLAASSFFALSASMAFAADLASPLPALPRVRAATPMFTWTGFYAGFNAGGARNGKDAFYHGDYSGTFARDGRVRDPALVEAYGLSSAPVQNVYIQTPNGLDSFVLGAESQRKNAFTAGLQFGYTVQYGGLVLGVEGDFNWIGGRRGGDREAQAGFAFENEFRAAGAPVLVGPSSVLALDSAAQARVNFSNPNNQVSPGPAGTYYNASVVTAGSSRSPWLSTLRGRTGLAFDQFMVYGTYGLAFQAAGRQSSQTTLTRTDARPDVVTAVNNIFYPVQCACVSTTNTYSARSERSSNIGWAAGLGFEWAFTENLSFGVEYVHADFGRRRTEFVDPVLTAAGDTRATRVPVASVTPGSTVDPAPLAAGVAPTGVTRATTVRDSHELMRVKLNYRFGATSDATPVVARY